MALDLSGGVSATRAFVDPRSLEHRAAKTGAKVTRGAAVSQHSSENEPMEDVGYGDLDAQSVVLAMSAECVGREQ
jgi:hypothetical protein